VSEGLKRAFKAARKTRQCPVKGCRRVKARGGDICREHQRVWDEAWAALVKK
jgi:hypothetical protein